MRFRADSKNAAVRQQPMVAGLIYGPRTTENWTEKSALVDFHDVKGDVEALLAISGTAQKYKFKAEAHPSLHPGQSAAIYKNDEKIGWLGALHPEIQQKLDIEQPIFVFELEQAAILVAKLPKFREISRYPEVRRDIAFVVDKKLHIDPILDKVRSVAGDYLEDLKVFDLYSGKGIDPQRKSVALGLTYQHPSRTLNEAEVSASVDAVVQTLQQDFSATLR
jgi:phenylalanyl-tRNA synthetase beta chain